MSKLTKEEVSTIKAFMGSYNDLFKRITLMEKELESLSQKRDSVHNRLSDLNKEISAIRKKEKEYNEYLVNKYGEFKLNLETFDIEPS